MNVLIPRVGVVCLVWMSLGFGTSGCAFSRGDLGTPLNDNDVSRIQKGVDTEKSVVALLGPPDSVQEINDRDVFHYYRYAMKHGTFLVFSRINVASDNLYVFFNEEEVVQQVLFGRQTNNLKFQFWPFGGTEGS